MFILYFSAISSITPPVAVAAFTAAGIADCNPMKAGFSAWKLGLAAFIVPFMFVYGPSLLGIGNIFSIAQTFFTASIGILALAAGLEGWLVTRATAFERIAFGIAAFLLIKPGTLTDLLGLGIVSAIVLKQFILRKRGEIIYQARRA